MLKHLYIYISKFLETAYELTKEVKKRGEKIPFLNSNCVRGGGGGGGGEETLYQNFFYVIYRGVSLGYY